jgi:hypothetical protein
MSCSHAGGFQQIGVSADLRIYWDEIDGRIAEAWCQGTMYRGYEMILIGRYPDDALATKARLCGICSTSHVVAATHALEDAWNITRRPGGTPAYPVLAAESVMSDARRGALFFGPGLCDQSFSWHPRYPEITDAFQPVFAGWPTRQVRDFSKANPGCHHRVHPPVAAFSSVPPRRCDLPGRGRDDIRHARAAVDDYAAWYTPTVLGGPLDQWAEVATAGQLDAWLEQHPHSVIALFSRFATAAAGLHRAGHGSQNLLSGGL